MCSLKEILLCGEEWKQHDTVTIFADLLRHGVRIRLPEQAGFCLTDLSGTKAENVLAAVTDRKTADAALAAGVAVLGVELTDQALGGCRYVIQGVEDITYEYCRRVFRRAHCLPWEMGRTGRCLIRELCLADLDDLYDLYESVYDSDGFGKNVEPLFERDKEEEYQRQYLENMYALWGYGMWLVWDADRKHLIGRAGLERKVINGENILEIGYLIAPKYRRLGYAYEVCQWILEFAAEHCPGEKLNAFIEKDNRASLSLIRKLGFHWENQEILQGKAMERYVKSLLF